MQEEKAISINFNEVVITAPNGEVVKVKDYIKIASTHLWKSAPTISLYQAALKLHDGEGAELSVQDIQIMIQIFLPKYNWILPFAAFPMLAYLESRLRELEGDEK